MKQTAIDFLRRIWSITIVRNVGIWLAVCAFLFGAYKGWEWKVRQDERVRIAVEEAGKREDFWRSVAISRKAKLKTSVKRFYELDTIYLAARDSLIADPLSDSGRVVRFVDAADSTVRACRALVLTCGETVLAQDSLLAALERQRDGLKKMIPGKASKLKTILVWTAVGFVAGNLATKHTRQ